MDNADESKKAKIFNDMHLRQRGHAIVTLTLKDGMLTATNADNEILASRPIYANEWDSLFAQVQKGFLDVSKR